MRKLEYRSPRVQAEFGVDFIAGTEHFRGACVDISEMGVRASFREHVAVGKVGSLILHHPQQRMAIPARVVYLVRNEVGFVFCEHTLRDRELVSHLMGVLHTR